MIRRPDERSDARERALYLLYEAHSKGIEPVEAVTSQVIAPDELTRVLVEGVEQHREALDELISTHARGWTLERMPVLDVQVMRLAAFELVHRPEVPTAVVLAEAVDLGGRFSTDDSGRFINGVLAAIARQTRPE